VNFTAPAAAELSTVSKYVGSDRHAGSRANGVTYDVETISLEDLLEKYRCPQSIDYLSIDTEGSEFEILSSFDFSRYDISIVSCEHNNTPNRERIYQLMLENGFARKLTSLSKWDDWYFKHTIGER